jgi:hypothetical protein
MRELMVLVERAVRPVPVGPRQKLRMREELLAHLTAVYEEELARLGDEQVALAQAARRFGDPAELTRELQDSGSLRDRLDHHLHRWFGARPRDSAARNTLRLAALMLLASLPAILVGLVAVALRRPSDPTVPTAGAFLRCWGGVLLVGTANVFLFSLLYPRVRDALHGNFGAPRSSGRAARFAAYFIPITFGSVLAVYLVALLDPRQVVELLATPAAVGSCCALALLAPVLVVLHARAAGPGEIRSAEWACLDLGA